MLLRRVIGDALRARRQDQHRTLREVSHAANVSLGYLSEIERGQKEASSELLAAICEALGSQLSDVLRDASDSLAQVERIGFSESGFPEGELVGAELVGAELVGAELATAGVGAAETGAAGGASTVGGAGGSPGAAEATTEAGTAELPVGQVAERGRADGVSDGTVSVSVRRNGPLRTTLHAVRTRRRTGELAQPVG